MKVIVCTTDIYVMPLG